MLQRTSSNSIKPSLSSLPDLNPSFPNLHPLPSQPQISRSFAENFVEKLLFLRRQFYFCEDSIYRNQPSPTSPKPLLPSIPDLKSPSLTFIHLHLSPKTPPNHSKNSTKPQPQPHPKQPQKPQPSTFDPPTFQPLNLPYPFNRSTHLSLHNAVSSDLSLPSSLMQPAAIPCSTNATSSDPSLSSVFIAEQQSFAANCLDRGQHQSEHDQQRSLAPYRHCPPLQQPCTLLPRLPPIAAAPLLQPTPPAATKSHRSCSSS
ncbi:hypothetical protein BHE74_00043878 [Ensete ventricosum]|nr:hypothetical protein BHE74_00043878 [Ensete ventricosum]